MTTLFEKFKEHGLKFGRLIEEKENEKKKKKKNIF